MLSDISFIKGQGGLGRPLAGEDFISAIIFYSSILPSGFSASNRIAQVFSLEDAENLGITSTNIGETAASSTNTVTGAGVAGDTIEIKVGTLSLGTAIVPATPTTATVAAAIRAAINAGTIIHGYAASGSTTSVVITAPAGKGVSLNGTLPTSTIVGTAAITLVAFASGAASLINVYHYHIAEYFRIQPQGNLYVGFFDVPGGAYDFSELSLMQTFADGKIRQAAIYVTSVAFTTSMLTSIQAQATILQAAHKPLSVLLGADISGTVNVSTLPDLRTLNNPNVSLVIGQDGANLGAALYAQTGKSITCLGAALGAVSLAKVSENIGWISKFQVSDAELDTAAFANGQQFRALSDGTVNQLDTYHYLFLRKVVGYAGTFFNYSWTATPDTSDYVTIENNRSIDKAVRSLRTILLPSLNGPVTTGSDGKLSEDTIAYFEGLCARALEVMQRDGELSAFGVKINPNQNVLATNKLVISVQLVPIGISKSIIVNIGYVLKIS